MSREEPRAASYFLTTPMMTNPRLFMLLLRVFLRVFSPCCLLYVLSRRVFKVTAHHRTDLDGFLYSQNALEVKNSFSITRTADDLVGLFMIYHNSNVSPWCLLCMFSHVVSIM